MGQRRRRGDCEAGWGSGTAWRPPNTFPTPSADQLDLAKVSADERNQSTV